MKQVFTLIEFEYDREVLPTEIQAAITKLLGVYPVKVESAHGVLKMKNCTCNIEDGIHEWDCAIEVEKRNNLEANKMLDRMAPFFGLEKKREPHGSRWAEKSASTKSRPTPRAADGAWDCQNCKKPNINAASKCWFCETPRR